MTIEIEQFTLDEAVERGKKWAPRDPITRTLVEGVGELRAINRDMLAALKWALTDIDAAITVVEHDRQESAHGLRQTKEKIEAAIARAEAHEGQRNNG